MLQIIRETHQEKIERYQKMTKLDLAVMLVNCNEVIEILIKQLNAFQREIKP